MSHKSFHDHGLDEIRLTVLQNTTDFDTLAKANPKKEKESADDYSVRIKGLLAKSAKRVDFHIFEAVAFLPASLQKLFQSAPAQGGRYELIYRDGKLIKTLAQISLENPQGAKEKQDDYQARVQELFDAQDGSSGSKTLAQIVQENPQAENEKPDDYKARVQKLFDAQS